MDLENREGEDTIDSYLCASLWCLHTNEEDGAEIGGGTLNQMTMEEEERVCSGVYIGDAITPLKPSKLNSGLIIKLSVKEKTLNAKNDGPHNVWQVLINSR